MKNILKVSFGVAIMSIIILTACGPSKNERERAYQDSLRRVDSIAQAYELAIVDETMRLEAMRQDSIRRDSIRKDSIQKDFNNQFIQPQELVGKHDGAIKKILKAKGYKITQWGDEYEGGWDTKKGFKNPITGSYYFTDIHFESGNRNWIYITFATQQDAKQFYKEIHKLDRKDYVGESLEYSWYLNGKEVSGRI